MSLVAGLLGMGGAVAAGVVAHGVFMPRSQVFGKVIYRGPRDGPPRVALSFDDGPHPTITPRLLDVLAKLQVKATFFMIGRNIEQAPEVVTRAHREGHLIANHSFTHAHLGMFGTPRYWLREMEKTSALITALTGERPTLFRPPMGFKTWPMHRAARIHDQQVVTWTRRAYDGVHTERAQILKRLTDTTQAGDIVTLHDGIDRNEARNLQATLEAIAPLVDAWRSRGLELVRLDQLIGSVSEPSPLRGQTSHPSR